MATRGPAHRPKHPAAVPAAHHRPQHQVRTAAPNSDAGVVTPYWGPPQPPAGHAAPHKAPTKPVAVRPPPPPQFSNRAAPLKEDVPRDPIPTHMPHVRAPAPAAAPQPPTVSPQRTERPHLSIFTGTRSPDPTTTGTPGATTASTDPASGNQTDGSPQVSAVKLRFRSLVKVALQQHRQQHGKKSPRSTAKSFFGVSTQSKLRELVTQYVKQHKDNEARPLFLPEVAKSRPEVPGASRNRFARLFSSDRSRSGTPEGHHTASHPRMTVRRRNRSRNASQYSVDSPALDDADAVSVAGSVSSRTISESPMPKPGVAASVRQHARIAAGSSTHRNPRVSPVQMYPALDVPPVLNPAPVTVRVPHPVLPAPAPAQAFVPVAIPAPAPAPAPAPVPVVVPIPVVPAPRPAVPAPAAVPTIPTIPLQKSASVKSIVGTRDPADPPRSNLTMKQAASASQVVAANVSGGLIASRALLEVLISRNKYMGAPEDDASAQLQAAQSAVEYAELLQRQLDASKGKLLQKSAKFVMACLAARTALKAAETAMVRRRDGGMFSPQAQFGDNAAAWHTQITSSKAMVPSMVSAVERLKAQDRTRGATMDPTTKLIEMCIVELDRVKTLLPLLPDDSDETDPAIASDFVIAVANLVESVKKASSSLELAMGDGSSFSNTEVSAAALGNLQSWLQKLQERNRVSGNPNDEASRTLQTAGSSVEYAAHLAQQVESATGRKRFFIVGKLSFALQAASGVLQSAAALMNQRALAPGSPRRSPTPDHYRRGTPHFERPDSIDLSATMPAQNNPVARVLMPAEAAAPIDLRMPALVKLSNFDADGPRDRPKPNKRSSVQLALARPDSANNLNSTTSSLASSLDAEQQEAIRAANLARLAAQAEAVKVALQQAEQARIAADEEAERKGPASGPPTARQSVVAGSASEQETAKALTAQHNAESEANRRNAARAEARKRAAQLQREAAELAAMRAVEREQLLWSAAELSAASQSAKSRAEQEGQLAELQAQIAAAEARRAMDAERYEILAKSQMALLSAGSIGNQELQTIAEWESLCNRFAAAKESLAEASKAPTGASPDVLRRIKTHTAEAALWVIKADQVVRQSYGKADSLSVCAGHLDALEAIITQLRNASAPVASTPTASKTTVTDAQMQQLQQRLALLNTVLSKTMSYVADAHLPDALNKTVRGHLGDAANSITQANSLRSTSYNMGNDGNVNVDFEGTLRSDKVFTLASPSQSAEFAALVAAAEKSLHLAQKALAVAGMSVPESATMAAAEAAAVAKPKKPAAASPSKTAAPAAGSSKPPVSPRPPVQMPVPAPVQLPSPALPASTSSGTSDADLAKAMVQAIVARVDPALQAAVPTAMRVLVTAEQKLLQVVEGLTNEVEHPEQVLATHALHAAVIHASIQRIKESSDAAWASLHTAFQSLSNEEEYFAHPTVAFVLLAWKCVRQVEVTLAFLKKVMDIPSQFLEPAIRSKNARRVRGLVDAVLPSRRLLFPAHGSRRNIQALNLPTRTRKAAANVWASSDTFLLSELKWRMNRLSNTYRSVVEEVRDSKIDLTAFATGQRLKKVMAKTSLQVKQSKLGLVVLSQPNSGAAHLLPSKVGGAVRSLAEAADSVRGAELGVMHSQDLLVLVKQRWAADASEAQAALHAAHKRYSLRSVGSGVTGADGAATPRPPSAASSAAGGGAAGGGAARPGRSMRIAGSSSAEGDSSSEQDAQGLKPRNLMEGDASNSVASPGSMPPFGVSPIKNAGPSASGAPPAGSPAESQAAGGPPGAPGAGYASNLQRFPSGMSSVSMMSGMPAPGMMHGMMSMPSMPVMMTGMMSMPSMAAMPMHHLARHPSNMSTMSGAPMMMPAGMPMMAPNGMPMMAPNGMPMMAPNGMPMMAPNGMPMMGPGGPMGMPMGSMGPGMMPVFGGPQPMMSGMYVSHAMDRRTTSEDLYGDSGSVMFGAQPMPRAPSEWMQSGESKATKSRRHRHTAPRRTSLGHNVKTAIR